MIFFGLYILGILISLYVSGLWLRHKYHSKKSDKEDRDYYSSFYWKWDTIRKHKNIFELGGISLAIIGSIFWPVGIAYGIYIILKWLCNRYKNFIIGKPETRKESL